MLQEAQAYKGSLTREQFLFHEMRTTAKLLDEGLSSDSVIKRIVEENLFQFPTEKMIHNIAKVCIRRLEGLESKLLIHSVATEGMEVAKQICLYAMMKDSRLLADFMITVIGEKFRTRDYSFGIIDLNTFFARLQEQNDNVASWSESTIKKIKTVIKNVLKENGYIESSNATTLNTVLIEPVVEDAIRGNNEAEYLPAFNCFN